MQPIHALSTEHVVGEVLVYNFQILFKQTSIIAAAIYKHVSVLPPQKRYQEWSLINRSNSCGLHFYKFSCRYI